MRFQAAAVCQSDARSLTRAAGSHNGAVPPVSRQDAADGAGQCPAGPAGEGPSRPGPSAGTAHQQLPASDAQAQAAATTHLRQQQTWTQAVHKQQQPGQGPLYVLAFVCLEFVTSGMHPAVLSASAQASEATVAK